MTNIIKSIFNSNKLYKKLIAVCAVFLALFLPIVILSLIHATKAKAAWWTGDSRDYVATANTTLLAPDSAPYSQLSFDAWFNPSSSLVTKTLIHKNNEFKLTTDDSGIPSCSIYYSAAWHVIVSGSSALPSSSWFHALCTYDGANSLIYINGTQSGYSTNTNSVISPSSTPPNIARNPTPSGHFAGQIDDLRIYNYTLTPAQVKTVFNNDSAVSF